MNFHKFLTITKYAQIRNFNGCCISIAPIFNKNRNPEKCISHRNFTLQSSVETVIRNQSGIFKSLSECTPVEYIQSSILSLHEVSGLPWWATIICTTVLLRSSVTVPLAIYQNYIMGKVTNIRFELMDIAKELKKETSIAVKMFDWDQKTANHNYKRSLKKQWNILVLRENCHPFKASALIWFQLPIWVCVSVALRNLVYMLPHMDANAQVTFAELSVGGFGWISNLTTPDPYFILALSMGVINLAIIEIQALSRSGNPTKFQRYVLNFFRVFSIFMVPVTACVPSGVALYWVTSSVYGLFQNLILMSPRVRRVCYIPETKLELQKPYSHVLNGIKNKFKSSKESKIS